MKIETLIITLTFLKKKKKISLGAKATLFRPSPIDYHAKIFNECGRIPNRKKEKDRKKEQFSAFEEPMRELLLS